MILNMEVVSEVILQWKWYVQSYKFKQVFICLTIISLIFRFIAQEVFFIKGSAMTFPFGEENIGKTAIAICTPCQAPRALFKTFHFGYTKQTREKSQKVSLWQMSKNNIKPSDVRNSNHWSNCCLGILVKQQWQQNKSRCDIPREVLGDRILQSW